MLHHVLPLLFAGPLFPLPALERDLIDERLWVDVNCAPGETFRVRANPDDPDERIIVCSGKPTGILRSDRMYENFEVTFEWRHLEQPANAGFFVWADPFPALGGPFTRGIEVQICNLGNGSWFTSHGDLFPIWGATMTPDPRFRTSGSRSMPREDAYHVRETGQWNRYRVVCRDGTIELHVNGHLVTAGTGCSPRKGYLCLESEGGEVHFRAMRLRELPPGDPAPGPAETASEPLGFRTLYNGLDLRGLRPPIENEGQWTARNWTLVAAAGADPLHTAAEFGDGIEISVDWKRAQGNGLAPLRWSRAQFRIEGERLGEWNRLRVRRAGGLLTATLDGRPLDAAAIVAEPPPERGPVALVGSTSKTEFANLFVRDLDP